MTHYGRKVSYEIKTVLPASNDVNGRKHTFGRYVWRRGWLVTILSPNIHSDEDDQKTL